MAVAAFAAGRPIVVADDADRENEGDIVFAAEHATAELMNLCAREARGLICIAMAPELVDRFELPLAPVRGQAGHSSPFTVSVEAAEGVTTGISAADRAVTARILADPAADSTSITTPGHLFPLRAHPDGLSARRGHTEAGVALARMAGLQPAAILCEIMADDGTMLRGDALRAFADRHGMPYVDVNDLARADADPDPDAAQRDASVMAPAERAVRFVAESVLPTRHGRFAVRAYRDAWGLDHLLLSLRPESNPQMDVAREDSAPAPLVRVHSECLTGDALGSTRCDCGAQLEAALAAIAASGHGHLVYLRQEGRGIGLANKIRAYALQDEGLDTVEANECLGFEADARRYFLAASMLRDVGVASVRLITNNPDKIADLDTCGITVTERIPSRAVRGPDNEKYLATKVHKLSHHSELIDD
jgi:3,4-dihydroxy 2-butanone 4-phosphate synthase/GTP cyclohydrolase II